MKLLSHLSGSAQDILYTIAGTIVSVVVLKSILFPNNFLDGGVFQLIHPAESMQAKEPCSFNRSKRFYNNQYN